MQKLLSVVLGAVFALAMTASHAGVAPALGGGAQAMSGAKISKPADSKASTDEHKDEKNTEQKESTPKQ